MRTVLCSHRTTDAIYAIARALQAIFGHIARVLSLRHVDESLLYKIGMICIMTISHASGAKFDELRVVCFELIRMASGNRTKRSLVAVIAVHQIFDARALLSRRAVHISQRLDDQNHCQCGAVALAQC